MMRRYYRENATGWTYRATRERPGLDWRLRLVDPVFGPPFFLDDVGVSARYTRVKVKSLPASTLRRVALVA